jgi:hypothetical protein
VRGSPQRPKPLHGPFTLAGALGIELVYGARVSLMTPNPPVIWPAGLWLTGASEFPVVLGYPRSVRLKIFTNSAR